MLGLGVIGCGRHGQRYLRHLANGDIPDARPVALWRRDPVAAAELAEETQTTAHATVDALVEDPAVDAVVIATPPGNHPEEIRIARSAGKPVLVEKPMTVDVVTAAAVVASAGPPVMVAQTLRYNPTLRAARARLEDLGPVHRLRLAQRLEPSPLEWQRDRSAAGGGSLHLTGVHLFDLLRWWWGRTPDRVQCRALALAGHPFENLFDACWEYDTERVLAATEVSKFGPVRASWLDAVGTRGQLRADYARGELTWWTDGDVHTEVVGDAPTLPATLADFVRVVRGEMESPIPARDGLETLRMIEACRRSWEERRAVDLTEIPSEETP